MTQEKFQIAPAKAESLYISSSKDLSAMNPLLPREKIERMGASSMSNSLQVR